MEKREQMRFKFTLHLKWPIMFVGKSNIVNTIDYLAVYLYLTQLSHTQSAGDSIIHTIVFVFFATCFKLSKFISGTLTMLLQYKFYGLYNQFHQIEVIHHFDTQFHIYIYIYSFTYKFCTSSFSADAAVI